MLQGWSEKWFCVTKMLRKVLWRGGSDDSAPFSSDKIQAKSKISEDFISGNNNWSDNLAPAGARRPVTMSTQCLVRLSWARLG